MGALGASSSLQSGFGSAGGLGGGVVPHSQSYHLGLNSMVSFRENENSKIDSRIFENSNSTDF